MNMLKGVIKFSLAAGIVVLFGVAFLFVIQELRYRNSPEYQAIKNMENLERRYAEDKYGGDTPEETLQLFIGALKNGDINLATKYFVLDKQAYWKNELTIIKDKKLLNAMVVDLERVLPTKKTSEEAFFTLVDDNNVAVSELIIGKNPYSQKWKIYEL